MTDKFHLMTEPTALDCYCGFGGSSQGEVFLVALDGNLIVVCGCSYVSARGFDAKVEHYRADLVDPPADSADYMDPADLPGARFAWFSPGKSRPSIEMMMGSDSLPVEGRGRAGRR